MDWYVEFAGFARGYAPAYEDLALGVSRDEELLSLLVALPEPKRQPNLLFGVTRLLGGPVGSYAPFRDWVRAHWPAVSDQMLARRTQTNEARRCVALLPALAMLPQPLALLELGASAGLCLYPDRYRYSYVVEQTPNVVGPSDVPVTLTCDVTGRLPLPTAVPTVTWRTGIDLSPVDVRRPEELAWLEALIWPSADEAERLARLRAAAGVVRADPPRLLSGDMLDLLEPTAAEAPSDATLVVFHTSAACYLRPAERDRLTAIVRSLDAHWISNEEPEVFPHIAANAPPREAGAGPHLVTLDERPLAWAASHGQSLQSLGPMNLEEFG